AVEQTQAAIKNGAETIYEATFEKDGISARVDILHRKKSSKGWDLIEVKSSTSVKPEHVDDVAIQAHVLETAGISVARAALMHLNNQSTAPELKNLFLEKDLTADILEPKQQIVGKIPDLKQIVQAPTPPEVKIGKHCSTPYECPFMDKCWSHIKSPSIFDFPGLSSKVWEFYDKGIINVKDPNFGPFKGRKANQLEAIRKRKRWVDKEGILEEIEGWEWPLQYLDFETIGFAIPRYDGTRPYQQIPFQFSLLIQDEKLGPARHIEYLHQNPSDPRPDLLKALKSALLKKGSIVAYNKGFESARLNEMASAYPEHADWLQGARERLVDPLPIFRNWVYDPAFGNSFSIKSVAPAILGKDASYEGMAVPDGGAAQRAFVDLINPDTPKDQLESTRIAMIEYCKKDTQVMVDLVNWLVYQTQGKE
ncbi:MAG: DUF2779 domain-containing protein, partial [Bdellovibrionota bacterium]